MVAWTSSLALSLSSAFVRLCHSQPLLWELTCFPNYDPSRAPGESLHCSSSHSQVLAGDKGWAISPSTRQRRTRKVRWICRQGADKSAHGTHFPRIVYIITSYPARCSTRGSHSELSKEQDKPVQRIDCHSQAHNAWQGASPADPFTTDVETDPFTGRVFVLVIHYTQVSTLYRNQQEVQTSHANRERDCEVGTQIWRVWFGACWTFEES